MRYITGKYYRAVTSNDHDWIIMRGSFEFGRFTGTPEEVKKELSAWDITVDQTSMIQEQLTTMNQARKASIIGAAKDVRGAITDIETIRDDIQAMYDELSEKAQEGERGEAMLAEIETLENIIGSLTDGADQCDEIIV